MPSPQDEAFPSPQVHASHRPHFEASAAPRTLANASEDEAVALIPFVPEMADQWEGRRPSGEDVREFLLKVCNGQLKRRKLKARAYRPPGGLLHPSRRESHGAWLTFADDARAKAIEKVQIGDGILRRSQWTTVKGGGAGLHCKGERCHCVVTEYRTRFQHQGQVTLSPVASVRTTPKVSVKQPLGAYRPKCMLKEEGECYTETTKEHDGSSAGQDAKHLGWNKQFARTWRKRRVACLEAAKRDCVKKYALRLNEASLRASGGGVKAMCV